MIPHGDDRQITLARPLFPLDGSAPEEHRRRVIGGVEAKLLNGASRALEITVKALPGSKNSLTNSVSVSSVSYDGSTGNNKATVTTSLNGKKQ